jgi:hypothetical protein
MMSELLNAIAAVVSAVAWPSIVLVFLLTFRKPVIQLLKRLKSVTLPGGIEVALREAVERAAVGLREVVAQSAKEVVQAELGEGVERVATGIRHAVERSAKEIVQAELREGVERLAAELRDAVERSQKGIGGSTKEGSMRTVWRLMVHHQDPKRAPALQWATANRRLAIGWGAVSNIEVAGFTTENEISAAVKKAYPDEPGQGHPHLGGPPWRRTVCSNAQADLPGACSQTTFSLPSDLPQSRPCLSMPGRFFRKLVCLSSWSGLERRQPRR